MIHYRFKNPRGSSNTHLTLSWRTILQILGPILFKLSASGIIISVIRKYLHEKYPSYVHIHCDQMDIDTIRMHLVAMNLIEIHVSQTTAGGIAEFIRLTELGKSTLIQIMAVRSKEE